MIYNIFSNYILGYIDYFIEKPILNTNIEAILRDQRSHSKKFFS